MNLKLNSSEMSASTSNLDVKDIKQDIKSLDFSDDEKTTPKIITILCCGEPFLVDLEDPDSKHIFNRFELFAVQLELGKTTFTILEMNKCEVQTLFKLMIKIPVLTDDVITNKEITNRFEDVDLKLFCDKYGIDTDKRIVEAKKIKNISLLKILIDLFSEAINIAHKNAFENFNTANVLGEFKQGGYRLSVRKPYNIKYMHKNVKVQNEISTLISMLPPGSISVLWRDHNIVFYIKSGDNSLAGAMRVAVNIRSILDKITDI